MPYPIDKKLVVGVSSNALFDLHVEDEIYKNDGLKAFKEYQTENKDVILNKGLAYPFIRRFLNINYIFPDKKPVEVVVLSKNSPEVGLRVFNSIKNYKLDISRAAFTSGKSPYEYIPAYNISLFLSTNDTDVKKAISKSYPAGKILNTNILDDENDLELRLAFDFDGVLAGDSSEQFYQECDDMEKYYQHETELHNKPLEPGLLLGFMQKISYFQKLEEKTMQENPSYVKVLRTAIITARNAPAHERAINTLNSWDVNVDEMFFLGGIEKKRILETLKPHLFIDDQINHLDKSLNNIPLVHIPFGIINKDSVD